MNNPFPGLRSFEESDALLFFGRDAEIASLAERLLQQRFLAVIGYSGCGKSSLVRAGLVPLLRQGILSTRFDRWYIATMRPGDGPLHALGSCITAEIGQHLSFDTASTSYGLVETLRLTLPEKSAILLIVDQFEEIFDYRKRRGSVQPATESDLFVSMLLQAVDQATPPIYVLLTMRSDFLGDCAQFRHLPEALNDGHYLVPRMTRVQIEEAITEPLEAAQVTMHPALLQELLNQCAEEPDNLPVLQHMLRRLFDLWTEAGAHGPISTDPHYNLAGRFSQAIDRDAEQALADVTGNDPERIARIGLVFQQITEKTDTSQPIRRPALISELAALSGMSEEDLVRTLNPFLTRGLLNTRPTAEGPKLDLPHECLGWKWTRLAKWIDEEGDLARGLNFFVYSANREFPLTGTALVEALRLVDSGRLSGPWTRRYLDENRIPVVVHWIEHSRELEHRQIKQLRQQRRVASILAVAASAIALLLAGVGWFAWRQRLVAETQKQQAVASASAATASERRAADREKEAQQSASVAEAERAAAERSRNEADEAQKDAKANASRAQSRQLAAEANYLRDSQPLQSIPALLSVEALRKDDSSQARELAWSMAESLPVVAWTHPAERARSPNPAPQDLNQTVNYRVSDLSGDSSLLAVRSLANQADVLDARSGRLVKVLPHQDAVVSVIFSPDSSLLATLSGSRTVRIFDRQDWHEVLSLQAGSTVLDLAFSADSKFIAAASTDRYARVYSIRGSAQPVTLLHEGTVRTVAFSPDAQLFATGSDDEVRIFRVGVWDQKEFKPLVHNAGVTTLAFSPDSHLLLTGCIDRVARLFDIRQSRLMESFVNDDTVAKAVFSPDSQKFATGSAGAVRIYGVRAGQWMERLRMQFKDRVKAIAFSPDSFLLGVGSSDYSARLIDSDTGRELSRISQFSSVNSIQFTKDASLVIAGAEDGAVQTFEPRTDPRFTLVLRMDRSEPVVFSRQLELAAGSGVDARTRIVDTQTGEQLARLQNEPSSDSLSFSPDSRLLATVSNENVSVVDWKSGRGIANTYHRNTALAAVFSPDSSLLGTTSSDATARILDLKTGNQLFEVKHRDRVTALSFNADSSLVATGAADRTAFVYGSRDGKQLAVFSFPSALEAIQFSPDSNWLALVSSNTLTVYDWRRNKQTALLEHTGNITSLRFSADSKLIAFSSSDQTARIADPRTGRTISVLQHDKPVTLVAFSPDSSFLATAAADDNVRIFSIRDAKEVIRLPLGESIRTLMFSLDNMYLITISGERHLRLQRHAYRPEDLISRICSSGPAELTEPEWRRYFFNEPYRSICGVGKKAVKSK
jgi:WD40 repeat protein